MLTKSGGDLMMLDLLVVTSTPATARQTRPGGVYPRFNDLMRVLAKDVGLDWAATSVLRVPCLPKQPKNMKVGYQHQGSRRPHDEILEQRNPLFDLVRERNPRMILPLGSAAANIVIRGRLNKPPKIALAEDRCCVFHAPYRHATWEDVERKRSGKPTVVREYDDREDASQLWPVLCTWTPGEVGKNPRLRNYYCEDIERALALLQEEPK